jgi:hypothetical protein
MLLMSSVSASAFAAKAPDPDPKPICFVVMGIPVCVQG